MRKSYNPNSPLHPTFIGPVRIIDISPQGALTKNPKTGEVCSVHFSNLRKLTPDEFLTILPSNFDSEILKDLKLYRFNRNLSPDPPPPQQQLLKPVLIKIAKSPQPDKAQNPRELRSSKKYTLNNIQLRRPSLVTVNDEKIPLSHYSQFKQKKILRRPFLKNSPNPPPPLMQTRYNFLTKDCIYSHFAHFRLIYEKYFFSLLFLLNI